jgi:hypothetical protein
VGSCYKGDCCQREAFFEALTKVNKVSVKTAIDLACAQVMGAAVDKIWVKGLCGLEIHGLIP